MTGIDPMRFKAVCDGCGVRESEIAGTRPEVIAYLVERSWRVTEDAKGTTTTCADCAPPSVFPAVKLTNTNERCSSCSAELDVCVACQMPFAANDVVSCRREHGHAHARCSTQKFPRFVLPDNER